MRALSRSPGLTRSQANTSIPQQTDRKLIEDYEQQVRELREKLDKMEDELKKKDEELSSALNGEHPRAAGADSEKKEWGEARADLESKLAEAQELNDSLQRELDRIRSEHESEIGQLKEQIEEARQSDSNAEAKGAGDTDLERENRALRMALEEQEQVTEEVRREAQEFLREMRMISQQSGAAWEKQSEMEKTIETLENEVRVWQNRYARAKTQLRDMRGLSDGLPGDQDAAKYVREKGFVDDSGLVKDIHVTKFQLAVDDLLQRARADSPERVMDSMKAVVVSVRRITKDMDASVQNGAGLVPQHQKLKSRVSSTANNLITASKNYANSAGISPVSLLDAAASHLVAAIVELLRAVKIRPTPAEELEEEDDGTVTPVDSTSFFSPQSNGQSQKSSIASVQDPLPPPPPFRGLGPGSRTSLGSSAYSPVSSPRESYARGPLAHGGAAAYGNEGDNGVMNKSLASVPNGDGNGFYGRRPPDSRTEELKIRLEDQTAVLVQTIQNLVQLIRDGADIKQVSDEIKAITNVVGQVVTETESVGANGAELVKRLASCRDRLMEAGKRGQDLAAEGHDDQSREWHMWKQTLPPIAFEIARETKELVQRVDQLVIDDGADDFA